MKTVSSRKGSALLIVLGMLAFMVVSAVSFSAYMRSSRLPSSYLRRTSAARQLAKAALAEAIERLDVAIGENAYPDQRVGDAAPNSERLQLLNETGSTSLNYWYNNVFIGGNTFLTPDDTVSTLTLEGLAYIPPPLVNEARRFSRLSHAATWHTLGFDSGRYAYCAIDVTDCLDVNRLVADGRRNSGRRRITMAHLFENAQHTSYDMSPSNWETFMASFRDTVTDDDEAKKGRISETKVPLVSMADWNLAINAAGTSAGGMESPFCSYLESASGGSFYNLGSVAETDKDAARIRAMRLITDSLLPGATQTQLDDAGLVDLASEDGQPFDDFEEGMQMAKIIQMQGNTEGFKALLSKLCRLDLMGLYDYLDYDSVPFSLGIPTTERVPMICAITPKDVATTLKCNREPEDISTDDDGSVRRKLHYKLNGDTLCSGTLKALAVFPFKRDGKRNTQNKFEYEACMRLFFAPKDITGFRLPGSAIWPKTPEEFKDNGYADGVFKVAMRANTQAESFPEVKRETEAFKTVQFVVDQTARAALKQFLESTPVFTLEAKYQASESGAVPEEPTEILSAHCNILPLGADGKPPTGEDDYSNDETFLKKSVLNDDAKEFALHVAVFVRVKEEGSDVSADLVPASVYQDEKFLGVNNNQFAAAFGQQSPLLRFTSDKLVQFNKKTFDALNSDVAYQPAGIMCPDPRFNHAPENWIGTLAEDSTTWLASCGVDTLDSNNDMRDSDIFMFVSDQEYLQSVYELAFLPNLSGLSKQGHSTLGNCSVPSINASSTTGVPPYPASINDCAHGNLMWKTYRCFDRVVDGKTYGRHSFEDIGLVLNDGAYRVNPCVQSVDTLMAAFANTPYDWWAASTNNEEISSSDLDSASTFNSQYAFSGMNSSSRIAWEDLKTIATSFRDKVREKKGDWEEAFDSMEWDGDDSDFCGADSTDLQNLSGVDRKFLYGFWHDSFANRQQLFLVFVRAEPTMMGGGSVNQTPPQLGARAVALVWRDPGMEYPSDNSVKPHRTRILFYRQFE